MATARLTGKGKGQKLVIDADEPGVYSVSPSDDPDEPVKLEFQPKGKKNDGTPPKKSGSTEGQSFFDRFQPVIKDSDIEGGEPGE